MRNEAIRFDRDGVLWGVENGCDNLEKDGVDIHNDNPSEELNRFGNSSTPNGKFYGYPYCWSEYKLEGGGGAGTQWVHPDFENDGKHSNAWCQDPSNVVRPALAMPAHVAPLDIYFYYGNKLPKVHVGDAFVSWHGSWNRSPPQGYKVVHVYFEEGQPKLWEPFLFFGGDGFVEGLTDHDTGKGWPIRPVGITSTNCTVGTKGECVYVTSDGSNMIVGVAWVTPGGEGDY
eukprot:TRINITY_DN9017_c0_g1_i1.p1 TRINITY_DN9017_c0_g1~~TRINITY_DN9017_c0_g1_i1.p1  ORF type:complete len:241 (-),score=37.94 TRINITY_DN9017_c0_g1_i1:46-735(-)